MPKSLPDRLLSKLSTDRVHQWLVENSDPLRGTVDSGMAKHLDFLYQWGSKLGSNSYKSVNRYLLSKKESIVPLATGVGTGLITKFAIDSISKKQLPTEKDMVCYGVATLVGVGLGMLIKNGCGEWAKKKPPTYKQLGEMGNARILAPDISTRSKADNDLFLAALKLGDQFNSKEFSDQLDSQLPKTAREDTVSNLTDRLEASLSFSPITKISFRAGLRRIQEEVSKTQNEFDR